MPNIEEVWDNATYHNTEFNIRHVKQYMLFHFDELPVVFFVGGIGKERMGRLIRIPMQL